MLLNQHQEQGSTTIHLNLGSTLTRYETKIYVKVTCKEQDKLSQGTCVLKSENSTDREA